MEPVTLAIVILAGGILLYAFLGPGSAGGVSFLTPRLNANQLATLASNAGFQGDDLTIAVAIALAESGGNPVAYNPETAAGTPEGEGSIGLWQIYTLSHKEFDKTQLRDPQYNANAAYGVYSEDGNSFMPWSTFKSDAYLNYLEVAKEGVANL